jgi:hypothetical protein
MVDAASEDLHDFLRPGVRENECVGTFAVGSASPAQVGPYKICRELMDNALALVRPGATTADIVAVWPGAQEFGFADEEAALCSTGTASG